MEPLDRLHCECIGDLASNKRVCLNVWVDPEHMQPCGDASKHACGGLDSFASCGNAVEYDSLYGYACSQGRQPYVGVDAHYDTPFNDTGSHMWHSMAMGVDHDFSRVFTFASTASCATMGGFDGDAMNGARGQRADSQDTTVSRQTTPVEQPSDRPLLECNEPDRILGKPSESKQLEDSLLGTTSMACAATEAIYGVGYAMEIRTGQTWTWSALGTGLEEHRAARHA